MKITFSKAILVLSLTFATTFQFNNTLHAQSSANAICKDGDCSPRVFLIQLNEPVQPAAGQGYSASRTSNFKKAYQSFQQIKPSYTKASGWASKRAASQLGGKSCLRHYQLESHFANEYSQNADFKKFVDGDSANANSFMENGFESSRRGLNLANRMKNNCPEEMKDVEKNNRPPLDELRNVYQKLGKDLGYFDEQGNLLKPMAPISAEPVADVGNLSKKQQVEKLKQQVAALPVGPAMTAKAAGIQNALGAAKPKLGLLKTALGGLGSLLTSFLPGPSSLVGKLGNINNVLAGLKKFLPKISVPNLLSKIGSLFKRGKGLADRAKDLVDNGNTLKDKLADVTKKADDLQNKLKDRESAMSKIQDKLKDLAKKKSELEQKLADKPKKILDELQKQVGDVVKDAKDTANEVTKENTLKDKLLAELEKLTKTKDDITEELKKLEDTKSELDKLKDALENETNEVEKEVEEVKKEEEKLEALKDKLEDLKSEEKLEGQITDCENELKKLLTQITGIDQKQEQIKGKFGQFLGKPAALLEKLSNIKLFQNKLKAPKNGIPLVGNLVAKVDGLIGKANAIGTALETITGKKTKIQEKVAGIDQKVSTLKDLLATRTGNLDQLKEELGKLISEKTGLKEKLNQPVAKLDETEMLIKNFIDRYNIFDEKTDCKDQQELEEKVEEVKKEQAETEPEIDEMEKELEELEKEEDKLDAENKEVEKEIEEQGQKAAELKKEEEAIKQEYGTDQKLEPVTVEEWSESFQVERPYWEAVFHPDDEVVEGQKGRYFEVKLKDANKNVKLLFGPGEYCMSKSDFRKRYGSTIGTFVTEALHAMKKADQQKVKLFIQGSADLAGHKTFSGNQDNQFLYKDINVLPQKGDDERFESSTVMKAIPERNFKNDHLPNLRGQYLKEMIKIYSKKFDPQVLEGAVKDFNDEGERNAIIYLFIPDELITE